MAEITKSTFYEDDEVRLINADVMDGLAMIESDSIQLVVTSPPYNIGKVYERDHILSLDEYLDWLRPVVNELCSKIKDGGSICWQVGNFVRAGEVVPLDYHFYGMFIENGFKLRNRIIWRFNFGLHATKRLSGRYETLLWFTKGDDYVFNLDPIRVPQLYPGKRHSSKKGDGRAGKPSGNPLGKNPSDFWTFSAQDSFLDNPVWDLPNVKSKHPEQTIHPCQFPHELAVRCVLAFSNPNDIVLDPFVGAGTSVIAALGAQRRAVAIDKSDEYVALTQSRVRALREGNLPIRPAGTAPRQPDPTERVAKVPSEWAEAVK